MYGIVLHGTKHIRMYVFFKLSLPVSQQPATSRRVENGKLYHSSTTEPEHPNHDIRHGIDPAVGEFATPRVCGGRDSSSSRNGAKWPVIW